MISMQSLSGLSLNFKTNTAKNHDVLTKSLVQSKGFVGVNQRQVR